MRTILVELAIDEDAEGVVERVTRDCLDIEGVHKAILKTSEEPPQHSKCLCPACVLSRTLDSFVRRP